ncbi:protein of unknown function (plasmid) [Caballeronia sp. S22]
MLGLKDFRCAGILLRGIELMHMLVKGPMEDASKLNPSAAQQFYSPTI